MKSSYYYLVILIVKIRSLNFFIEFFVFSYYPFVLPVSGFDLFDDRWLAGGIFIFVFAGFGAMN